MRPYFKNNPTIRLLERGYWELVEDLTFVDADGTKIVVPAGFKTDGASIPSILWPVIGHPISTVFFKAATLHDWEITNRINSFTDVSARFRRALRATGVGKFRAQLMYLGVRVFGTRWKRG